MQRIERSLRSSAAAALALWAAAACTSVSVSAAEADLLQRLEDRAQIEALVASYVTALDTLDADLYAAVFAEDAELEVAGTPYRGREEIVTIVTGLQNSRAAAESEGRSSPRLYHVLSNTRIELTSDTEARHESYWQTVRVGPGTAVTVGAMGRYEDTVVKRDGRWQLLTRKIIPFSE